MLWTLKLPLTRIADAIRALSRSRMFPTSTDSINARNRVNPIFGCKRGEVTAPPRRCSKCNFEMSEPAAERPARSQSQLSVQ
jgi:hypothetical protein